jgi:hypothetical protein
LGSYALYSSRYVFYDTFDPENPGGVIEIESGVSDVYFRGGGVSKIGIEAKEIFAGANYESEFRAVRTCYIYEVEEEEICDEEICYINYNLSYIQQIPSGDIVRGYKGFDYFDSGESNDMGIYLLGDWNGIEDSYIPEDCLERVNKTFFEIDVSGLQCQRNCGKANETINLSLGEECCEGLYRSNDMQYNDICITREEYYAINEIPETP